MKYDGPPAHCGGSAISAVATGTLVTVSMSPQFGMGLGGRTDGCGG